MANSSLHNDYPWTKPAVPIIISAPMLKIASAKLAVEVSAAGGIGFMAAGFDLEDLPKNLAHAAELTKASGLPTPNGALPIGVGFLNWGAMLQAAVDAFAEQPVAAVWFFGPKQLSDLLPWTKEIRAATNGKTKIWVQVGTVAEAVEVAKTTKPDVLVIQGADSGGHGLSRRAGIISLFPEVADLLAEEGEDIPLIAAGGIADGRGVAAALTLGADGVVLGTRFIACSDAAAALGYQKEVLRATDGGTSTVGSTIYDQVREIPGWPETYFGRGIANRTYMDAMSGMDVEENIALYKEEMRKGDEGWGPDGRMTTYAGTVVGLVKEIKSAKEIVEELQQDAVKIMSRTMAEYRH